MRKINKAIYCSVREVKSLCWQDRRECKKKKKKALQNSRCLVVPADWKLSQLLARAGLFAFFFFKKQKFWCKYLTVFSTRASSFIDCFSHSTDSILQALSWTERSTGSEWSVCRTAVSQQAARGAGGRLAVKPAAPHSTQPELLSFSSSSDGISQANWLGAVCLVTELYTKETTQEIWVTESVDTNTRQSYLPTLSASEWNSWCLFCQYHHLVLFPTSLPSTPPFGGTV